MQVTYACTSLWSLHAVCKHDVAYGLFPAVHFRVVMFSAGDFYLPVRQVDGICAVAVAQDYCT